MLYKRLIWLIKISFPDSLGHVWPEKPIEAGGAMQKLSLNSRLTWKKVTTIWKNIHLEKFQPYGFLLLLNVSPKPLSLSSPARAPTHCITQKKFHQHFSKKMKVIIFALWLLWLTPHMASSYCSTSHQNPCHCARLPTVLHGKQVSLKIYQKMCWLQYSSDQVPALYEILKLLWYLILRKFCMQL